MSTNVTLEYDVIAQVPVTLDELSAALAAIDLDFVPLAQYGAVSTGDTTSLISGGAKRVLTFSLDANFNVMFPPASDQGSAFRNYFTQTLAAALVSSVTAVEPVFS